MPLSLRRKQTVPIGLFCCSVDRSSRQGVLAADSVLLHPKRKVTEMLLFIFQGTLGKFPLT